MSDIFRGILKRSNPILVLGIGNNVNNNCGCLYHAEPVYIAHFYMLISLIYIHDKRKRPKIRK